MQRLRKPGIFAVAKVTIMKIDFKGSGSENRGK
jgi:hypothetical protein